MGRESIYWVIVLLTFVYIFIKHKGNVVKLLIILCFYSGLAAFPGKTIENPFKIFVVILSIYLILKDNGLSGLRKKERIFLMLFILYSLSFFYSAISNGDYFNLTLSQYAKYFTPVCVFFVLNHLMIKWPGFLVNLRELFFQLLTIQIVLSVVKVLTLGLQESTVGSISYIGGGQATMVPVLGFILVWLTKKGEFTRKDWRYIILLIFIAFASVKRAIWFIMPAMIVLFMFYIPRKIKTRHLIYVLPIVPLLFYAGVRLNPTLNREGKIGGSFDLQYVLDYSQEYSFGQSTEASKVQEGTGRGGATIMLVTKLFKNHPLSRDDYWGTSLQEVYTTDYDQFNDEKYGLNSKGSVTGIFQSYISSGYVGVFLTILLILSVVSLVKEPRIRISLGILIFWDYLFYSALILRTQALFILFFYIILYSNSQFEKSEYDKYVAQNLDGRG